MRRAIPRAPPPARCCRSRRRAAGRAARRRPRARCGCGAEALEHRVESGGSSRMSGPSRREARAAAELEHRPVPVHGLVLVAAQHEPRAPGRASSLAARRASGPSSAGGSAARARPRSGGAGSSPPPRPTRAARPSSRSASCFAGGARMRRLDLDPLSGEHLQPRARRDGASRLLAYPQRRPTIRMARRFIGVRWWLGSAFALVAAVSTALVVSQFSTPLAERVPRPRAGARARQRVARGARRRRRLRNGKLGTTLPEIARQQDLELHRLRRARVEIASASPRSGGVTERMRERAALLARTRRRPLLGSTSDGRVFVGGRAARDGPRRARRARRRGPTSQRRSGSSATRRCAQA